MRATRLVSDTPASSLRWVLRGHRSWRGYALRATPRDRFCVSSRSTEATVVLDGELWIRFGPHDQEIRLRSGEAAVVSRGMPHRCHVARDARFVVLDMPTPPEARPGVARLPGHLLTATALRSCRRLWDADAGTAPGLVDETARDCLALALDRLTAAEGTHNSQRMVLIKRELEARYTEPLTLASLARQYGLDRHYLVRAFKRCFGVPPLQYVQFLRMEHFIWEALRAGSAGRSCGYLANDAGFGDYPTFCRRVRERFGAPPSALVQLARP